MNEANPGFVMRNTSWGGEKGRREPPLSLSRDHAAERWVCTIRSSESQYVVNDGISLGTRF